MDGARDVPDSTDWLKTPLATVSDLENALHCQICKEFYDTPMITSCSHTFCSKCIRTSLSENGRCPACRAADQASKLRNNWQLQEVVAAFLVARPAALKLARQEQEQASTTRRPGKRKRAVMDSDDVAQLESESRTTRSKSRRLAASQTSEPEAIEIDDSDEDGDLALEQVPDDGLVECPLGCGKRMKVEAVEPHLDRCEDEKQQGRRAKSRTPLNGNGRSRSSSRQTARPQDRIAELNYSLMNDKALRKKFDELGIPSWGSKQLLVKRHTEWVNLWNAMCDSNNPRTKRQLLQDLDTWERTQGGRAPNANGATNGVMRKDFDGAGWAKTNKDDFSRLIADARRKKNNPATSSSSPKDVASPIDATKPALDGSENSSPYFAEPPNLTQEKSFNPYEDNEEAMSSIRQKVEAANAGQHMEPVMNAGFARPDEHALPTPPSPEQNKSISGREAQVSLSESAPQHGHSALLENSHFGIDGSEKSRHGGPRGIEDSHRDMPAPVQTSPPRKMPMFAMPEHPVKDTDGEGGAAAH